MKIRRHVVLLAVALVTSVMGATVGVTASTSASPAPAISAVGGTAHTNSISCIVWLPWLCF